MTIVGELFEIFRNPNLIPPHQLYRIESSFYALDLDRLTSRECEIQHRIVRYTESLKRQIALFDRPLWVTDFRGYIQSLLRVVSRQIEGDFWYFEGIPEEVSLSRCLFGRGSKFRPNLDQLLEKFVKFDPGRFVHELTLCSYQMIPGRDSLSAQDQSLVLLLLFRALFHRAYERFSHVFCPPCDPDVEKLFILSQNKAKCFELPPEMISSIGDLTVREVVAKNGFFVQASGFLFHAVFEANPIDAVYDIQQCMLAIHKGALVEKLGEAADSVEDADEVLSFDDLFSLFFVVMLATDLPDFFHLGWLVTNFTPKEAITPQFGYILAHLEALMIHSRTFKL
jgi:hypothetical protein